MAAERLAPAFEVTVFDRMPSPGRKLLMAGRGGLNLTHGETLEPFLARYGDVPALRGAIEAFPPAALVRWAQGLGQEVFTGSSGRMFPRAMKASPLLRAWLARLAERGVALRMRQEWQGWAGDGSLNFEGPDGRWSFAPDATILALGGASWPRLGSNGAWSRWLDSEVAPFAPSNMGFEVAWSEIFKGRFAGTPLKRIALSLAGRTVMGEAMITGTGIEGSAVYAMSAAIRDTIAASGPTVVRVDLRPDLSAEILAKKLAADRGSQSLSNFLRSKAGLAPVAIGLVQEALHRGASTHLAMLIKSLPLTFVAPAPIARAISTAGGVRMDAIDAGFMLNSRPGVFVAGEMLDWEAPTGGYLLQACFSTGAAAAHGIVDWLATTPASR